MKLSIKIQRDYYRFPEMLGEGNYPKPKLLLPLPRHLCYNRNWKIVKTHPLEALLDKNTPRIPLTPFTELTFPSRVRAVFLDLDGTLLDSMGVWSDIDRRFLAKRGLDIPPDYLEAIVPLSYRDTALYTTRRFG